MKDIMGLMKQAKEMQEKMKSVQEDVADLVMQGRSGGGLVTVTLAGGGKAKLDEAQGEAMKSAMGGLQLPPGMKMPF